MTSACIHGFAPRTCLICQTLDGPSDAAPRNRATTAREPSAALKPAQPAPAANRHRAVGDRGRSGPRVVPTAGPSTSAVVKLLVLATAVVAVIVVAWTVLHIVLAVLHVIELIGVALVTGYLGWLAGVHHGHRTAGKETGKG